MKSIKETIQSRLGFYIGDAQKIIPKRLKHDARIHCAGGGKWKDPERGAEIVGVHVGSSYLRRSYYAKNGDRFDVLSNTFSLVPLELVTATGDNIDCGRVVFGAGDATFETVGETIKITLPSTEIVEIYTGRTNQ